MRTTAVIAGAGSGSGFSVALVRQFAERRHVVLLVHCEETRKQLSALLEGIRTVEIVVLELTNEQDVAQCISRLDEHSPIDVLVHTAARLVVSDFASANLETFRQAWNANVGTAVVVAGEVLPRMAARRAGTVIFTGATASLRGGINFSPFASAKFALRGLAQSLSREYRSQNIHVAHIVIDGIIWGRRAVDHFEKSEANCIAPAALAKTVHTVVEQPLGGWTHELDVRAPFDGS